MLRYGSDHSPNLYATVVHKNVAAEEFASLLPLLTVFLSIALFFSFLLAKKNSKLLFFDFVQHTNTVMWMSGCIFTSFEVSTEKVLNNSENNKRHSVFHV